MSRINQPFCTEQTCIREPQQNTSKVVAVVILALEEDMKIKNRDRKSTYSLILCILVHLNLNAVNFLELS